MRRLTRVVLFVVVATPTFAQDKFTINGTIKDASNGEALIGATVYIKEIKNGATTNEYGFYSITLPPATYTID
ncbi:MAG: carboxypeptidase-like regulatory domain-containing protein, partial [Cyclobacteriaceae bacterium]|nr:carboxypeptidase-like regulatory domain-containing protein [Cyclobacteriaceae bacterium]